MSSKIIKKEVKKLFKKWVLTIYQKVLYKPFLIYYQSLIINEFLISICKFNLLNGLKI
jgi:hypothetical protein